MKVFLSLIILFISCIHMGYAIQHKPQPVKKLRNKLMTLKQRQLREGKETEYKITASTLALTLGVFGVHRLYLETDYKVPIAYTLTLGGGFGILPASDIIAIWASPELEPYLDNSNFVMWVN